MMIENQLPQAVLLHVHTQSDLKNIIYVFVYFVSVLYTCLSVHERSEDIGKLVLSFHHVGPRDGTQVVKVGSRC